jgi:hypothetical protein
MIPQRQNAASETPDPDNAPTEPRTTASGPAAQADEASPSNADAVLAVMGELRPHIGKPISHATVAEAAVRALTRLGWRPPEPPRKRCACNHWDRFCWYMCHNSADATHAWPDGQWICEPCSRQCDPAFQPGKITRLDVA